MTTLPEAQMTEVLAIQKYITGGKAVFTIRSNKTGNRFTYRIRKTGNLSLWYVDVLTGSDNTGDYTFIGLMRRREGRLEFGHSYQSTIGFTAPSVLGIRWFIERLNKDLPLDSEQVEFWHSGRCSVCARELTDPESIARGIGPKCAERS